MSVFSGKKIMSNLCVSSSLHNSLSSPLKIWIETSGCCFPYARSGASCDGRSGAVDRVSQRRRRHWSSQRIDGDDESRSERSRRRLRLLGCLRCGNQHGDVCVHHFAVYAPNQWAVCTVPQNDGKIASSDQRNRRSTLLQARFLPLHPCCHRLCKGAVRRWDGKAGGRMPLATRPQSSKNTLKYLTWLGPSLLSAKKSFPLSKNASTHSGLGAWPAKLQI